MMELYFYQAECGDAARISYRDFDDVEHNILIDSGFERTFRHLLADEIKTIVNRRTEIDLWVISHIHDDHIGGVIKFLKAVNSGELVDIVKEWYYNAPRKTVNLSGVLPGKQISELKSIGQGDQLSEYLAAINKLPAFDITVSQDARDFSGLKLTVLSPGRRQLDALQNKYRNPETLISYHDITNISEPAGAPSYDYHIRIEDFDLVKWTEDDSIENSSSIAVLTEYKGKNILWLADSHPDVVSEAILKLGYSAQNPLTCEFVKVSHHGSKGNNNDLLYGLIQSNRYVFSVNGENKHCLPTKECIARILRHPNRPKNTHYHFYFTYDTPILRQILDIDGPQVYDLWNFTLHYPEVNKKYLKFQID